MKIKWIFTGVTFIIGLMIAIQFQTTQEPIIRDTRDIRELRRDQIAEQEKRQELVNEIEKTEALLSQYQSSIENSEEDIIEVLLKQIEDLKERAGLTEVAGEGIIITIESLYNEPYSGQSKRAPSAKVLRILVNDLNIYGAEEISIGNERIIATSAFRDVNNITHLNNRRLPPLPLQVKVLSENPERLLNQMVVSASSEYFEIEGYSFEIEQVESITIPAYDKTLRVRFMEEVKEG